MITRLSRTTGFLAATAVLAACSGGSTLPSGPSPESLRTGPSAILPLNGGLAGLAKSSSSACAIANNGWYFRGPCKEVVVPYTGKSLTFPSYRGLTLNMHIGANTVDSGKFVFGFGTSDTNITGTVFGHTFPEYGTVGCLDPQAQSVPCKGKGFLYVLFYNPPDQLASGIRDYPMFRISNTGEFPGTQCHEDNIEWNSKNRQWLWMDQGISATPQNGSVTFKAHANWIITFEPGSFEVVGFHCS